MVVIKNQQQVLIVWIWLLFAFWRLNVYKTSDKVSLIKKELNYNKAEVLSREFLSLDYLHSLASSKFVSHCTDISFLWCIFTSRFTAPHNKTTQCYAFFHFLFSYFLLVRLLNIFVRIIFIHTLRIDLDLFFLSC